MSGVAGPLVTTPGLLDVLAGHLLHGGAHPTESSTTVGMEYVSASVAFVGLVGGLLYWYFRERVRSP